MSKNMHIEKFINEEMLKQVSLKPTIQSERRWMSDKINKDLFKSEDYLRDDKDYNISYVIYKKEKSKILP